MGYVSVFGAQTAEPQKVRNYGEALERYFVASRDGASAETLDEIAAEVERATTALDYY